MLTFFCFFKTSSPDLKPRLERIYLFDSNNFCSYFGRISWCSFCICFWSSFFYPFFCFWLCWFWFFWIEGDRGAQIRLDKQAWDAEKIRKKCTKWFVFYIISFLIANVFLAYLIGSDELIKFIEEGPTKNTHTLIALIIFTYVFYFIYAWFREQVCIIACPYGRMQGVLLDNKTINVAYDYVRGEKEVGRAKFNKQEDRAASGKGDCIDCKLCVHVCPTGIDIRNGVQLECVNCTACIDECDHIMESVGLPKGLIRYASEVEIVNKEKFVFNTRMKGYASVLLILTGVFIGMLFLRNDVEATILHLPGQLFEHKGEKISNVYTFKVVNKTEHDFNNVYFKLVSPKGEIKLVGKDHFTVKKQALSEGTMFIEIDQTFLKGDKTTLQIEVYNDKELIDNETTNFLGPRSFN